MTGRDRARPDACLSVNPQKRTVTVEHANIIKRHTRPNPAKNIKGGIVEKEGPITFRTFVIVCPGCNKHTRLGHKMLPDGTKYASAAVAAPRWKSNQS